jgi:hypothetical protein
MTGIPKKPFVYGDWETILDKHQIASQNISCGQVVDHCFFQDQTGTWQAWVQIRDTEIGRVFTRWEQSNSFHSAPWTPRGICWKADHPAGESVGTSPHEDVIQAPYVLRDGAQYLLVYGGGPIEPGDETRQVCLGRSSDGISFVRERNADGFSRIAIGPHHAADAFLLKHNDEYLLYVGTQHFTVGNAQSAVMIRKSRNLRDWSEPRVVHYGGTCGTHTHSSQSIFVCFLDGYFYLFKMGWSSDERTAVYRSTDPEHFGLGDDALIAVLNASAAEIINSNGQWYLSSLIIPDYSGVKVAPLKWVEDVEHDAAQDGESAGASPPPVS